MNILTHSEARSSDQPIEPVDLSPDAIAQQDADDAAALADVQTPSDDDCPPMVFAPLALLAALAIPSLLLFATPATAYPGAHRGSGRIEVEVESRRVFNPGRRGRPAHQRGSSSRPNRRGAGSDGRNKQDRPTQNSADDQSSNRRPNPPAPDPWEPNPDLGSADSTLSSGGDTFIPPVNNPRPETTRGGSAR